MRIRKLRSIGTRRAETGGMTLWSTKDYAWRKMRNRLRKAGNRSSRRSK